jgi:PKD repeat protein
MKHFKILLIVFLLLSAMGIYAQTAETYVEEFSNSGGNTSSINYETNLIFGQSSPIGEAESINYKQIAGFLPATTTALVANFSADETSGYIPFTVNFTDISTSSVDIILWEWDFDGDGTPDAVYTEATNPTWVYDSVGIYDVSLTITTSIGTDTSELKEDYITVTLNPNPVIQVEPMSLNFGNVIVDSTKTLPMWIHNLGGSDLTVSFIVSSLTQFVADPAAGVIIASQDSQLVNVYFTPTAVQAFNTNLIYISNDPASPTVITSLSGTGYQFYSEFSADVTEGQIPLTVTYTDLSYTDETEGTIVSWDWDFDGDGTVESNEQNPIWEYTTAGDYTVSLKVTDNLNNTTEIKTDYIWAQVPPTLVFDPVSADFGNVVKDYTKTLEIWIYNTGELQLDVTSTLIDNDDFEIYLPVTAREMSRESFSIAPADSQLIYIDFTPTLSSAYAEDLVILSNDPNSPSVLPLSGTGYDFYADFTLSDIADTLGVAPHTVQFLDNSYTDGTAGTIQTWNWDFDNDSVIDSYDQNPFWQYTEVGCYDVKLTVSDIDNSVSELKIEYICIDADDWLHVPEDYLTIQAAIDAAETYGDTILIAEGTYIENLNITGKEVTLTSEFILDHDESHIANTIIDGSGAENSRDPDPEGSVMVFLPGAYPNLDPWIIGLTIQNGIGRIIEKTIEDPENPGSNIVIEKRVGGGVYIEEMNPIFQDCDVKNNSADDEGGGGYVLNGGPNFGGTVEEDIINPGGNLFQANFAAIGKTLFIDNSDTRTDTIKAENCHFDVYSYSESDISNYWSEANRGVSFANGTGDITAITAPNVYVSVSGDDTNSGLAPGDAFKTIDFALSSVYADSTNPVTINIGVGQFSTSFTGEKFPLQLVNWVSLVGNGTDTVLNANGDANNPVRVFQIENVSGVTIESLTITGGYFNADTGRFGGGIYCSSANAELIGNYIISNSANDGGGIYCLNSNVTLTDNIITDNTTPGFGGGVFFSFDSVAEVINNTISDNEADRNGAGIYCLESEVDISDSEVSDNVADMSGGGIFVQDADIIVSDCDISANIVNNNFHNGGGLILLSSVAEIIGNDIYGNAAYYGGGIYSQNNVSLRISDNKICNNNSTSGAGIYSNSNSTVFIDNVICNNEASSGGGIYCLDDLNITNNTISNNEANSGGGLYCASGSSAVLLNTILWNNLASSGNQIHLSNSTASPNVTFCDVDAGTADFGGAGFTGAYTDNIDSDPLFVVPSAGTGNAFNGLIADWALQASSPCIDEGDPATDITSYPLDIAGNPRISGTIIDMGAYEFQVVSGPDSPENVNISVTGTALEVSWDDVTGANSYKVFSSDDPYGAFEDVTASGSFDRNRERLVWTFTPIGDAKKFYYVRAVN